MPPPPPRKVRRNQTTGTGSSEEVPRKHRHMKGADAGTGSSGGMPLKSRAKENIGSSRDPPVAPLTTTERRLAARERNTHVSSSPPPPPRMRWNQTTGTGSSEEGPRKPRRVKGTDAGTSSSGVMLPKSRAKENIGPTRDPPVFPLTATERRLAVRERNTNVSSPPPPPPPPPPLRMHLNQTAGTGSSEEVPRKPRQAKETNSGTGSSRVMPPKSRAKDNIGPSRDLLVVPLTATERRLAARERNTNVSSSSPQSYTSAVAAVREKKKKQQPKTSRPSGDSTNLHRKTASQSGRRRRPPADHIHKESAAANKSEICCQRDAAEAEKIKLQIQEADEEIRKLNELGVGEEISGDEYMAYLEQLTRLPDIDFDVMLEDPAQLQELNVRHALYRIRYFKLSQQVPEDELRYDKLKRDYPLSLLQKEYYFQHYEEDGKLDWSFHPDYRTVAALDDYQRIVPINHIMKYQIPEYMNWKLYHKNCCSYDVEQEYVKFCEELSKKLKWMEPYALYSADHPITSVMWHRIMDRGSFQAMKIAATAFSKIYGGLAFYGFNEWLADLMFDVNNYTEYDGVYYEIWQRVTKQKKSFRDALDEVYKLDKFPFRQENMRRALEMDLCCSNLEDEFLACTDCITEEIAEYKARELILEALRKEKEKPKSYEQYCRKKIDIARTIGLIS